MTSKIQIYLEHKEHVFREIEISSDNNLEQLHLEIIKAFDIKKDQIGSFYMTNSNFDLLQEIPLFNMEEENKTLSMKEIKISSILRQKGDQLLYVYDFLLMWRFLITIIEQNQDTIIKPRCIRKIGYMPKTAPNIQFEEADFKISEIDHEFDQFDEYH